MADGPGKYDDLVTDARKKSSAAAAVVIIMGGDKGSGFGLQLDPTRASDPRALLHAIVHTLRSVADQIATDAGVKEDAQIGARLQDELRAAGAIK